MWFRRLVKTGLATLMYRTGTDRLIGRLQSDPGVPLVLGYHRVVDDFRTAAARTIPAMLISRKMLERHLEWLGRRYRFISLDELGQRLSSGRPFRRPVVAITFDDGYRDVYEHALPVLRARGIPAAIFIATDFVAHGAPLTHDRLYLLLGLALGAERVHPLLRDALAPDPLVMPVRPADRKAAAAHLTAVLLGRLNRASLDRLVAALEQELGVSGEVTSIAAPLTWPMLREMQRGGFTVGCHTHTHAVLPTESAQQALLEVRRSREIIEAALGTRVEHFAYPDGQFNRYVVDAVCEAGIRYAYTTCRHRDPRHPLLTIPRQLLWEHSCLDPLGDFSPAVMSGVVRGAFGFMEPCNENHRVTEPPPAADTTPTAGHERRVAVSTH
ncbi:MAG TPA: polysaccharide deacetylase family protein [Vicinamibacterales bacterium]